MPSCDDKNFAPFFSSPRGCSSQKTNSELCAFNQQTLLTRSHKEKFVWKETAQKKEREREREREKQKTLSSRRFVSREEAFSSLLFPTGK
jgi:hypothetical protein